jgi:hypothetical protein
MNKRWAPSPLEVRCLEHLDAPGSWDALRTDTPRDSEILPWKPFRRVFAFNFGLFFVVLVGLFFGIEHTMSTDPSDLKTDLPYGIGFAFLLSVLLGSYVMHLYRQSWNKRAMQIQRLQNSP